MKIENETVLVLAPHTDDAEFGCGGTIAKMIENGCNVHCAAFSICEESVPAGFPKDALKGEFQNSMKSFGLSDDQIHIYEFRVRRFNERRQDILEEIIKLRKLINPTVVFAPSVNDIHQDHNCIAVEAIRAFKNRTLFAYEIPWNHLEFRNGCFVELTENHIEAKLRAIECYKTQGFRTYSDPSLIRSQLRCRGVQGGVEYAEMFDVVRIRF